MKGWVHQATLTGRRSFVVTGAEQTMRAAANDTADPVARLKPGVIGRLRACASGADWCQVSVHGIDGYLRREAIWGLLPGDAAAPWCQVQVGEYRGWLRRDMFWGIAPGEAVQ